MKDGMAVEELWALRRNGRFVLRRIPDGSGEEASCAVWVPAGAEMRRNLPVILALHGSGECGCDGRRPTAVGLGPVLPDAEPACQALVVFPQARPEEDWCGAAARRALAALDAVVAEFSADPERVALTGLSLGGAGVWYLAATQPRRFHRLAVVCGWLDVEHLPPELRTAAPHRAVAERLRGAAVRTFHGMEDDVVPCAGSRQMVAALRAAGVPVEAVEYPGVGHGAWIPAYRMPGLVSWLAGA